ncbi:hypothetical protein Pla163_08520 [Planctomycetes bacterium Pla163]|uniref:FAR-17a/AIG1-like protein n=1 Tax=Rohdeia mirabilis TaxID=2528008 RepID=A0A518CWZ5_9BACT|nr:hypothetical protein Pla163_08520 [Planctomycetes bacterium Pla163]
MTDPTTDAPTHVLAATLKARAAAAIVASCAAAGLLLRVHLAASEHGSHLAGIAHLSQFFTILSNVLVLLLMVALARGTRLPRSLFEPTLVAIVAVGLIYHVLLAHLWSPQGLSLVADQTVHTVVPGLVLLWWALFDPPVRASWATAWRCTVWPLVYCAYALLRAESSGFYPYPFLDPTHLGWGGLFVSVLGLSAAFLVLGLLLVAAGRLRLRLV